MSLFTKDLGGKKLGDIFSLYSAFLKYNFTPLYKLDIHLPSYIIYVDIIN